MLADQIWCWHNIIVEKHYQLTLGLRYSSIARRRNTAVGLQYWHKPQGGLDASQICVSTVCRSIGDDDYLKLFRRDGLRV
jgi:hypothetical protein